MWRRVGERDGLGGERREERGNREQDQEGVAPAVPATLACQCGLVLDRKLVEALFVSVHARRMTRAGKVKRRVRYEPAQPLALTWLPPETPGMESPSGIRYLFAGFTGAMLVVVSIAFAGSPVAREVFDGIRASATLVVAGFGVWVANQGLRTWQRSMQGTAQFEASKEFLAAAFQLRAAIAIYRSPLVTTGEMAEALKSNRDGAGPTASPVSDAAFDAAMSVRWAKVGDALNECRKKAVNAEVLLGPRVAEVIESLSRLLIEIQNARVRLRRLDAVSFTDPTTQETFFKDRLRLIDILNDMGSGGDFSLKVKQIFAAAESLVTDYIRPRAM